MPAKKLPDNAAQYHPAMLLSNMRPDVKLNLITDSQVPGETRFKVGTEIDGHKFEGFGLFLSFLFFFYGGICWFPPALFCYPRPAMVSILGLRTIIGNCFK